MISKSENASLSSPPPFSNLLTSHFGASPIMRPITQEVAIFLLGIAVMVGFSRLHVFLPWSPVPITGQTLGMAWIALTFGLPRAPLIVSAYLVGGLVGLPFFVDPKFNFTWGPTTGYLVGMWVASFLIAGSPRLLAKYRWGSPMKRTVLSLILGEFVIFGFGVANLSLFISPTLLWTAGILPFLPGEFIKMSILCAVTQRGDTPR